MFNSGDGSVVKSQTVKSGVKVSKPADPTKGGYVFKGWYTDWVGQAAKRGLMTDMKDDAGIYYTGNFEPGSAVTRAMVATVLRHTAGSSACSSAVLWDGQGHWSHEAVAWCISKGIVTGYTSGPNAGRFLPDNEVTREELATMAYCFAKWAGVKTANPPCSAWPFAAAPWVPSASRP